MMDFSSVKRIVIKVGTSTLAHNTGNLNIRRVSKLIEVMSDLKNSGKDVIFVTSGAQGASVYFHGINPPCLPLVWAVPDGGMHTGAFFHFMQRSGSGFRLFQNAERQRHPAVVAEGKAGRHVMLLHPGRRPAGEAIHRCPGGQAHVHNGSQRLRLIALRIISPKSC